MTSVIELVNGKRGVLLKIDIYLYCLNTNIGKKYYWKCVNWKKGCKGSAQTELKDSRHNLINSTDHSCEKNLTNNDEFYTRPNASKTNNENQRSDIELRKAIKPTSIETNKQTGSGIGYKVDEWVPRRHMQFKHPFTCMIAGPTSSGKTVLVRRIIKDYDKTFFFKNGLPSPLRVIWAYGQWQDMYNESYEKCQIQYIDGIPSDSEVKKFMPHLIIIDDLMSELSNDKNLTNLFTKGSHHLNISVIFIAQNIFYKSSEMRTINLNSHYLILMKNPKDKSQIRTIASRMYPGNSQFLIKAYEEATKIQFGYIRIDSHQETPDELRIQTRITPDEIPANCNLDLTTIVYYW